MEARQGLGRKESHALLRRGDSLPLLLESFRPEIRRDYPLNLSILVSGGKETNEDSLSNGE